MIITELKIVFQIPVMYPTTAPELAIPELDGKTAKMFRYVDICILKLIFALIFSLISFVRI